MLEKQIEQYLNKKVKALGGLCFKWISTITGVPDRIVFLNQKIHLVELKTKNGVLSERQKIVFQNLADQGFPVLVLRSREDVDNVLQPQGIHAKAPINKVGVFEKSPGADKSKSKKEIT